MWGLAAAIACAPSSRTAPAVGAPTSPAAAPRAAGERWIVRPNRSARDHRLRLVAELESSVDSVVRADTLLAELLTSWTYSPPPRAAREIPARISGELREYQAAFGAAAALETPPGLSLPIAYAAESAAGGEQPRLTLPRAEECTPAAAALAALRELWVAPPDTLEPGTEWADSLEFVTCRDSVPISVRSTRSFRVLGAESRLGQTLVLVARRSVTQMSGSGSQFGEPLQLEADGEGSMQLWLSLDGGAIVEAQGDSELRMRMTGRRRVQQLVQRTSLTISRP